MPNCASNNNISFVLISAIFLVFIACVVSKAHAEPGSPAASAFQAAPLSNGITRSVVQIGVLSCASRIEQVTNFLGFGPQAGAALMQAPNNPDHRLVPLVMEIPTQSSAAYVSATFAPNQANGCGATYDAVVYWPNSCSSVATKQFASLKKTGSLKKDITILDGGVSIKVYLMQAGKGCVSIKKEVVQ